MRGQLAVSRPCYHRREQRPPDAESEPGHGAARGRAPRGRQHAWACEAGSVRGGLVLGLGVGLVLAAAVACLTVTATAVAAAVSFDLGEDLGAPLGHVVDADGEALA